MKSRDTSNNRHSVLEDEIVSFAGGLSNIYCGHGADRIGKSPAGHSELTNVGRIMAPIIPPLAQGTCFITALTLWGSAYRYRRKAVILVLRELNTQVNE